MEARLRQLGRRANEPSDGVGELAAYMRAHLRTKREFEDAFEDAGTADAFAARIGLPDKPRALLLRLQAAKDIFVPNALLDGVLTGVFLVEVALLVWHMADTRMLAAFAGALLLTDAVISRVKTGSAAAGMLLAGWLQRVGAVDHNTLASRIQMKKWTEQAWQLAIHVGFAAAEGWLLTVEPWFSDPITCWLPHPYEQTERGHRWELQVIYVSALVRGGGWEGKEGDVGCICGKHEIGPLALGLGHLRSLTFAMPITPAGGVDLHVHHPPLL